jgi:site-specific recombinase XerD
VSRLLDSVRAAVRARRYSLHTEEAYVRWIRQYILFLDKRHPSELGPAEISAFVSHLTVRRKVSASTQNHALPAPLFLYREVLDQPVVLGVVDTSPARVSSQTSAPNLISRLEFTYGTFLTSRRPNLTWPH